MGIYCVELVLTYNIAYSDIIRITSVNSTNQAIRITSVNSTNQASDHSSQLGRFVPASNLVCITEVAIRTILCIAGIIYYTCNLITDSQCIRYRDAFNKRF